ncbi:MAG TPA: cell envelope integrity protein TolA, partial [Treponemataceae bacterium]|nr:cell envelope integrity protein TolA [Treponemataceae bacterium]
DKKEKEAKKEKRVQKERKIKAVKKYSAKKLPSLFKKAYTQKKFEKQIEKRLLVLADKNYIVPLFVKNDKQLYSIPKETEFTKKELLRLKRVAKQIKKQKKWRINIFPLLAVLCFAAALIAGIFLFKDYAVKKALTSAMEGVFKAKCDIDKVSVNIFGSQLTVMHLAQADKNNTFVNVFEIDNIDIDFDLLQLLKKKFAAENIELSGLAFKTQRNSDGALPLKAAKNSKSEIGEGDTAEIAGMEANNFMPEDGINLTNFQIDKIFDQYNPEKLITDYYSKFKSPAAAEKVQREVSVIIPKWQTVPNDFQVLLNKLIKEGQSILSIDIQSLKTQPEKITETITLLIDAYAAAKEAQLKTEAVIFMLKDDAVRVKELEQSIRDAVTSDMVFVKNQMGKVGSFKFDDAKNLVTDSFSAYLRGLLGDYYPYFVKGVDSAKLFMTAKKNQEQKSSSPKEKEKVRTGRIIEYTKDNVPSILIKKVKLSGGSSVFTAEGTINDISNDMEKWGKPLTADVSVFYGGIRNEISCSFDCRESSDNILTGEYNGNGFSLSTAALNQKEIPGIPVISGKTKIFAKYTFKAKDNFDLTAAIDVNPAEFKAAPFNPPFIYELYNDALTQFTSLDLHASAQLRGSNNFTFSADSSIDEQFSKILGNIFNAKIQEIKDEALKSASEYLSSTLGVQIPAIDDFYKVFDSIQTEYAKIAEYRVNLEQKINEARTQLTGYAEDYVLNLLDNAYSQLSGVADKAKETVDKAKEAADKAALEAKAMAEAEAQKLTEAADKAKEDAEKAALEAKVKAEAEVQKAAEAARIKAEEESARLKAEAEAAAKKAAEEAAQKAAQEAAKKLPKLW